MKMQKSNRGVTLVEIAIVLVIIGLLLGGILKGQELINNAKVRAIADRQNSLKVAWYAFVDRYQSIPGDYTRANQNVPGAGKNDPGTNKNAGNGIIEPNESPLVFQHLTGAGYLRCPQCAALKAAPPTVDNSLTNNYGGVMAIFSDGAFYASKGASGGALRLFIHTGPRIPSNIIEEVDRKLDDGIANTGDVVFNNYDATNVANAPKVANCTTANVDKQAGGALGLGTDLYWRWAQATPPVIQNCGASVAI